MFSLSEGFAPFHHIFCGCVDRMWVVYYYSTMHLFWPQCYKMVFWPLENRPILTVVKKILRNRLKEETDANNLLFAVNFTVWHRFKIHLVIILVQCLWLLQLWKLDHKKKIDSSWLKKIIYRSICPQFHHLSILK